MTIHRSSNAIARISVILLTAILLSGVCYNAGYATQPPIPGNKGEILDNLQRKIKTTKEKKASLSADLNAAETSLKEVKEQLVNTGRSVSENERILTILEQQIDELTNEKQQLENRLKNDYANVSDLILALQRIRRVPPEALIIRPGAPLETAQSALVLQTILPAIQDRALALSRDLSKMNELEDKLVLNKRTAMQTRLVLKAKYVEVEKLVKERQKYFKDVNKDYTQTVAALETLGKEAKSLEELLTKIEEKKPPKPVRPPSVSKWQSAITQSPLRKGQTQPPVSGRILTAYGETDNIGAASQGLRIEGTSGGLVVAPLRGKVQFAGKFKNYGQLVILEHADGYHSLIGGMEKINVSIGERLDAGEPIGKLAISPSRSAPVTVYYELRYKGRPVNPARKISNLES